MAIAKLIQTFSLGDATINQSSEALKLAPNEFVDLFGFISEKGCINATPPLKRLKISSAQTTKFRPGAVLGLYSLNWGVNGNWLIAAIAHHDHYGTNESHKGVRLYAFLLDFSKKGLEMIRRVVGSDQKGSHCVGLDYNFFEYRNKLFVSNGFETYCFDGNKWSGPNNYYWGCGDDEWQQLGKEISFTCGIEFYERAVLGGTPAYPNEITFSGVRADINEKTTWAGITEAGGVPTVLPLNAVCFLDDLTGVVAGENGILLRTTNGGKIWDKTGAESVAIRGLCYDGTYIYYAGGEKDEKYPIYRSNDKGLTWESCPHNKPIDYYVIRTSDVGKVIAGGGYSITDYGYCVYSEDSGSTWSYFGAIASNEAGPVTDIAVIQWDDSAKKFLCSCASLEESVPTKVLRYYNTKTYPDALVVDDAFKKDLNGIVIRGNKAVVIGDDGGIWRTDDFTATTPVWVKKTVSEVANIDLNAIAQDPADSNVLYVVGDSGKIIKSTDFGDSWVNLTTDISANLRDVQVVSWNAGETNFTKIVVCGDTGAFYYSIDEGLTWRGGLTLEEANKFSESVLVKDHEQVRAMVKAHGRLYVGTSGDLYVYDPQFAQSVVCKGLSVLNPRCMVEYANNIWVLGYYNNVPGLWIFQGEGSPILASRRIQKLIEGAEFEPAPKFVDFIIDSESDWQCTSNGIVYDNRSVKWHGGFLRLPPDRREHIIYSHGIINEDAVIEGERILPVNTTGFYLGDCAIHNGVPPPGETRKTRASDIGYLGLVIAFNSPSQYRSLQKCDVFMRMAPSKKLANGNEELPVQPDPGQWTEWISLVHEQNESREWRKTIPQTGQKEVPGVYWLRFTADNWGEEMVEVEPGILKPKYNYYQDREPYKWFQFKIVGRNMPESNWALKRVIFRGLARASNAEGVTQPTLLVWDNKLFGFLSNGGFVVSNDGKSISTLPYNSDSLKVNCATVHQGRLIIGNRIPGEDRTTRIFYNQENAEISDSPFVARLTTGRFGNEGQYMGHNKILRRIRINAYPQRGDVATCKLSWWADGRENTYRGEKNLTFYSAENTTGEFCQNRVVELPGPTVANSGTHGKDFTIRIESYEPHIRILNLQAEYDIPVPEPKETDFGGHSGIPTI